MSEAAQDGRIKRTASTRLKILTVTRELILSGHHDPTAKEIANAANVTTRTLFRHFADMPALHRSLVEYAETGASKVMDEPFAIDQRDDWQACLRTIIDRRVRVYESMLPLYVSTVWRRYQTTGPKIGVSRRRRRLKEILPERFTKDEVAFEALDATLSIEFWVSLRRDQGLSVKRATQTLTFAVEQLTR